MFILLNKAQHRNSLDGFTQPHIVCENTIYAALVKTDHPVQADKLVVFQAATTKDRWLGQQACERLGL